jgi:hypothetical protein
VRRIEQLAQRESYRQEQRKDLEPVDQPAEVRGDQHPPLLAIERPIPRQLCDAVLLFIPTLPCSQLRSIRSSGEA